MTCRKTRVARAFATQAESYDAVAMVQNQVALRLADRIKSRVVFPPGRILEIGCGTGLLSMRLAEAFPDSEILLTDIAPAMLDRCRARLGVKHRYQVLDGERPKEVEEKFDLIVSSLAFQWFDHLRTGLERLSHLLTPNGRILFATLGCESFTEWRHAHENFGLSCGMQIYPAIANFPWPDNLVHTMDDDYISQRYENGRDFVRSLKELGAREPAPGYHPLKPGTFRRLLGSLDHGFPVTYHILYGEVWR